jgi:hypothetical protein
MRETSFRGLLGKRTLIYGDVGTGKTRLTVRLLEEALKLDFTREITVIDMAPKSITARGIRVGGRLSEATDATRRLRYLAPRRVETPRLAARNGEELLDLVEKNRRRIGRLLKNYVEKPTPILFVNDVSIYLQSGDFETLAKAIEEALTFVANGYYGKVLSNDYSTGISALERELMDKLAAMMDLRIRLD